MYFIDAEKQLKETWFDSSMKAEKQDFYVCFLWVLKNINRDILKQYIKQEVVSKIHTFVDIIETAMDILKSGLNKKERHQKKYQSLAECYLEERRKRITDICSMFKLDDTEKAKMLGEIPTLNEQEKQPSRPVNPKISGKPPQGQNQFVPSPGLGSTLAIEKSLLKLQAKFGIEMTQNVEVIVPDPIRDNILYDDSLLVMLDVVECIFEGLFDRQDVDEMKKITDFITNKMFVNPPPAEYIKRFFQFIRKIIRTHGDYLFKDNLDFTFKLLKGIISYCNSKNQIIRVDATSVFYLFTRTNYVILGSTQCTRIHAIASLAETEPSSSSPSKGDHSSSKNSYFKRCCNTLDQWARLDFSQEKFHGKKNNDAQAEVVDIIDVNAFETYRNNVIKRRLSLLKFINKEQNGGDRKWRTKERVIRQLENLWKEDPVDEVMEKTNQLLESCKVQVQAELTIGGLKTSSVECARNFLEYVRNSIALVGEHSMDDKIYDQHVQTNNEKLNSLYNEYVQLSKKLQEVGSAVIVHSDGLNELLELTSMLLDSRKNITEEETNVRKERTEKINEFEQELKQTSVELVKSYTDACSQLITSSGEVINLTKSQQQLNQTIVKLNALTELAKKHHENFLNKEKEVFSISPWATIFKNWNNVLPISVYVLEQTTRFQNQLNTHEKETFEANEQMDIELSASEELVKSYAWEIAVQDVLDFVIGTHPSNDIVVIAGKLNQRFRSINASYKQIKQQSSLQTSTENGQSEKTLQMFSKLLKKLTNPQNLRTSLLSKMKELNADCQKTQKFENSRQTLGTAYHSAASLLSLQDETPSAQFRELTQTIRMIELSSIPNMDKYVNRDDVIALREFVTQHENFAELLPVDGTHKVIPEEDESNNKQFGEELLSLKDKINVFLSDLESLEDLKKSSEQAIDLITERKFSIAQNYIDCPQIHISWFETIASDQEKRENYVEAGVAVVHVVHFIYCALKDTIHELDVKYLESITTDFLDYQKPSFHSGSDLLTTVHLVGQVKRGAKLFEKAKLYTYAIALYNFIIPFFASNKDYNELADAHKMVNSFYTNINEPFIWYYYCVGFYGKTLFGENHKKRYIYRSSKRAKDFAVAMCDMHTKKIGDVGVKPDWKTSVVDEEPLSPYITVVDVKPFKGEGGSNKSTIEFVGTNLFVNEKSVKSEKRHPGLEDTRKIRTTYTTLRCIPSVLERELIVESKEVMMTPIQCCIDDVDNKLVDLKASIAELKETGNVVSFQPKLKGILVAEVNGGIGCICETFLKKGKIENYGVEDVILLYSMLQKTLVESKKGLTLHKSNMKPEHAGMHVVFDRGYVATSKSVRDVKHDVETYVSEKGNGEEVLEVVN
ncbi:Dedicator of cytokinesis protein [Entamoeba marina]